LKRIEELKEKNRLQRIMDEENRVLQQKIKEKEDNENRIVKK
jgi:hypothetical protein